jgi:hypothetical protein
MTTRSTSVMNDFLAYAKRVVRTFTPLTETDLSSFRKWIDGTPYSGKRKIMLTQIRKDPNYLRKMLDCKCFLKDESYEEPKNPRAILSYTDFLKTMVGPVQHDIDKATFTHHCFIKGSNPRDWPSKLSDRFGCRRVMQTDFSSFEAHHHGVFSAVTQEWITHMLRQVSSQKERRLICGIMSATNRMIFNNVTATIPQRLMSGAMWTSSANGVLNLSIMSYLTLRTKFPSLSPKNLALHFHSFSGYVEGDDGICAADQKVPQKLIDGLGIKLKFDYVSDFSQAKFCGIICDPIQKTVVMDPKRVLRSFFSLPIKYKDSRESVKLSLLRAKALSYSCNMRNCPVIGPLAYQVCCLTKGFTPSEVDIDGWKLTSYRTAVAEKLWAMLPDIHISSRIVTQERFNVTIDQQLALEKAIYASTGVFELDLLRLSSPLDIRNSLNYIYEKLDSRVDDIPTDILSFMSTCEKICPRSVLPFEPDFVTNELE